MSIKNKIVSAFSIIIGIMLLSSLFVSFNIKNLGKSVNELEKKDFKGITVLLEADRDSYQSNIAIAQIFSLKDKEKIKELTKSVNENLNQVKERFDLFKNVLSKEMKIYSNKFKECETYFNLTKKNTEIILSLINQGNVEKAKEYYFNVYQKDYKSMRNIIDFFSEKTYTLVDSNIGLIESLIYNSLTTFIIISIISLLVVGFFTYFFRKNIDKSFSALTKGVVGFFDYLNRKSKDVKLLDDTKNDEIGTIAKVVNENIMLSKKAIEDDRKVIDEIISVLGELAQGDLSQRIDIEVFNPSLKQLKNILNKMASTMQGNIDNILDVLLEYSNYNYTNKVEVKNLQKHFLKLSMGINNLNDSITGMLVENSSTGTTLNKSSLTLLENVEKLSKSSNASAVFLEETAAALEEVTSTVIHNTQNVEKITQYASNLKDSSNDGEKLAKDTAISMDEINEQTQAIAEAITVIDQIAFQTNILSLNAAVEAATAGEAGKGFAVVAQEVRNLASRSAEAAKEIKDLVENATIKANQGKVISDEMIEGYHGVNENIGNTLELIQGISVSSKQQQSGIEQINNAISDLDQQTQNNASVASLANEIATQTLEISKEIVQEVNDKSFRGKEEKVVNL